MAELYAIDRAIMYIIRDNYERNILRSYSIVSDSMSALQAICSISENGTYILNLKNKIQYLGIELYWTRAHVGAIGNERADSLVKKGLIKN